MWKTHTPFHWKIMFPIVSCGIHAMAPFCCETPFRLVFHPCFKHQGASVKAPLGPRENNARNSVTFQRAMLDFQRVLFSGEYFVDGLEPPTTRICPNVGDGCLVKLIKAEDKDMIRTRRTQPSLLQGMGPNSVPEIPDIDTLLPEFA